jgi:heme exporter protein C
MILGASLFFILVTVYMILYFAPTAKSGFFAPDAQRVFYLHLPSAITSYIAFSVVFVFSIIYLKTSNFKWDKVALSAAEIGIIFCSLALLSGGLWGKAEWDTYWRWEDIRLVTFLILWLIFSSYLGLRSAVEESEKRARLAAVFGIVGFVGVPLSYFSMYIWQTLHPIVISPGGGGLNAQMGMTLGISFITFILFFVYLLLFRIKTEHLVQRLEDLKDSVEELENGG